MSQRSGRVYLVGAGPGDPGLLTLRGAECLADADVVLYDYLAAPELLEHVRPGIELICLGRHGHGRLMSQAETNELMILHAKNGRTVVRFKGGDPAIFARLAEEIAALEAADVSYEIVPGVTAASAASCHAGVPLTNRDEASCVAFITGQERPGKDETETLDYGALAAFPGTLVFYMGITTAPHWSQSLVEYGKPPSTPVAVVRRASLPDQETIYTTLDKLPQWLKQREVRPPAVVIVGDVARERSGTSWFARRPLHGQTVLITRPEHQSGKLAKYLRSLGANVLCQPAIEIVPLADWSGVDAMIDQLRDFDWLMFSSCNGVCFFMQRLFVRGYDVRHLGGIRLAAIGPATVEALAEFHLAADVCAETYRAEALAEALAPEAKDKRILLLRASRGREVLAEILTASGAIVEQVVVYESRDIINPNADVLAALRGGDIDIITVTSSAIARSLVAMFGESLRMARLAAISPLTAEVLAACGFPAAIIAEQYTSDGLVHAILGTKRGKP